jgi:hypothetical protein
VEEANLISDGERYSILRVHPPDKPRLIVAITDDNHFVLDGEESLKIVRDFHCRKSLSSVKRFLENRQIYSEQQRVDPEFSKMLKRAVDSNEREFNRPQLEDGT